MAYAYYTLIFLAFSHLAYGMNTPPKKSIKAHNNNSSPHECCLRTNKIFALFIPVGYDQAQAYFDQKKASTLIAYHLEHDPSLTEIKYHNKNSPLHFAASHNHLRCAQRLLTINQKMVNFCNIHGNTPLHIACTKRCISFINFLLKRGASITIQNKQNRTSIASFFFTSIQIPSVVPLSFVKKIREDKDQEDNTQLHLTAKIIRPKKISNEYCNHFHNYLSFLENHGINIHARNKNGDRAVDSAINEYHRIEKPLQTKIFLNNEPLRIIHQEFVMHALLRATNNATSYALLKEVFEIMGMYVDCKWIIMKKYCVNNIETVIAYKYSADPKSYYEKPLQEKKAIRESIKTDSVALALQFSLSQKNTA